MRYRILLLLALLGLTIGAYSQKPTTVNTLAQRQLCRSTTALATSGNLTQNIIFQCAIPANTLGLNSLLQIRAGVNTGANASNCAVKVLFGSLGTTSDSLIMVDSGIGASSFDRFDAIAAERNSSSAQYFTTFVARGNASLPNQQGLVVSTTSASTASIIYVTFTTQLGTTTDTCTLNEADVTLWP